MHCLQWIELFRAFFISTATGFVRVTAEKSFPLHYICSVDYDFWSFGVIQLILDYFDNGSLLKQALGAVVSRVLVMNKLNITKARPCNILQFFTVVKRYFQIKNVIFFFFCSKNKLWVHVGTALLRRFKRVPTIYVLEQNKKIMNTSVNPSFTI